MFLLISFESFITARPPGTTKGPLANYYVVDISSLKPTLRHIVKEELLELTNPKSEKGWRCAEF